MEKVISQDDDNLLLSFNFFSRPDQLKLVRAKVNETLTSSGCLGSVVQDFVIAIDEACQNIIRHAYKGKEDGEIILKIYHDDNDIVVLLRDFANTIDPQKIKPRDLNDVRPGGLGTHFMKEVMDEVRFMPTPLAKGNLLLMKKKII